MPTWEEIRAQLFDPYKWNFTVNTYTVSGEIPVQRGCNSIEVTNIGDTAVQINGIILFPSTTPATVLGNSISLGGNLGETYQGKLSLMFVQAIGALPQVQVIQKFYIAYQ